MGAVDSAGRRQTHRVTTPDGFPLAVQVSGTGPAVLLLAGQANAHTWWDGVRPAVETRHTVVTFDYRGTGASRGPVDAWSTPSFADDAALVVTSLGRGPLAVYGTSMGGRVAQWLAIAHPHLVTRLVLACTSPGGPHAVERGRDVRRALADPDAARRLEAMRRLFYTDAWPGVPAESHLFGDPTMTGEERQAHLRASARHDAWARLPEITAPTLVIHGTDDVMVPTANAAEIADRVPGAQLRLFPGGRHGFFEELADDVDPVVEDFLAGS
jgi:pimeloyl-ACP methyl ester carboxylesterase